jgi:hypothetical protein
MQDVNKGRRARSIVTFAMASAMVFVASGSNADTPGLPAAAAGTYTQIDFPGADHTFATGINARGDIVGYYFDPTFNTKGFVLHDGVYTSIGLPAASQTTTFGIADDGKILGAYYDDLGWHGFVIGGSNPNGNGGGNGNNGGHNGDGNGNGNHYGTGDSFTTFEFSAYPTIILSNGNIVTVPTLEAPGADFTQSIFMNLGREIVGVAGNFEVGTRAFLYRNNSFTMLDVPGTLISDATSINDVSVVIGSASDADTHGFIYRAGVYSLLDMPGAVPLFDPPRRFTYPTAINHTGSVVGFFYRGTNDAYRTSSFLFTPSP